VEGWRKTRCEYQELNCLWLALILAFSRPPPPRLWRIFEEKVLASQGFGFAD
jgi:hypothetical protein